jgi:restriction system protein
MSERHDGEKTPPILPVETGADVVMQRHRAKAIQGNLIARQANNSLQATLTVGPLPAEPILLQATVVKLGAKVDEGRLIETVLFPWYEIIRRLKQDPEFLHRIEWHTMEQVIAGAYKREGWEVTLTPRGVNDGGKDVIATRPDFGTIRFFDQVKTLHPGSVVEPGHVDAMLGVLTKNPNVSKGIITTTADFAPSIFKDKRVIDYSPSRLQLRNGKQLREWLTGFTDRAEGTV